MAHDYQEKCKQVTTEKKEVEERMSQSIAERDNIIVRKDKEIEVLKENYETVMRLNKQSTDCVKNLEDALEKVCKFFKILNPCQTNSNKLISKCYRFF